MTTMNSLKTSLLIILVGLFLTISYWQLATPHSITFSDAVKFADSARNVLSGEGRLIHHSFFCARCLEHFSEGELFSPGFLPVITYAYAPFIYLFGSSDTSILYASVFFYLWSLVLTFLLGKKLFNSSVGFLASMIVATNPQLLELATSGASETLFIFLTLLAFLIAQSKSKIKYLSFIFLVLIFFTRHQAFIVIGGFLFFWIMNYFPTRRRVAAFIFLAVFAYLATKVLHILSNIDSEIWYSPFSSLGNVVYNSPLYPNSSALRSTIGSSSTAVLAQHFTPLFGKLFYNLYHFVKNFFSFATPIFSVLFLLGFYRKLNLHQHYFRLTTYLTLIGLYLAASMTIPNLRYILSVLPLVAILSADFCLWLLNQYKLSGHQKFAGCFLLLFFSALPVLGHIFIDYRFRSTQYHQNQPSVNLLLSVKLAEYVPKGKLVVTNLDAWASWYQGLTTMWFPLEPSQLITQGPNGEQLGNVDYIFLTDYKINDSDFALSDSWKTALFNPEKLSVKDLVFSHFVIRDRFTINASTNYEKLKLTGIIYQRKP